MKLKLGIIGFALLLFGIGVFIVGLDTLFESATNP